ncbi:Glycosyltransferase involved in cell wall bisynthesis [Butyrivibrio fibrisolvens]|uniref:Glycosyltransferase involved in cell wall bisynthesis n=1 Tax=Butyrivibrio fibrisolvens TaxID=831 RepID=A0A1H9Q419_BUTFI|nr:glycosyltransferase family 2 protein [Butyrivibrio fibrisolvens]SER55174.1 Glycosyltransferase involved in cell wall bisynthesis [Butyrivibrio fibrisolvens]
MKYSFLVPVYNVENLLKKCVDSIMSQKPISEEYEIILVDDGSTDSSGSICDDLSAAYANIRCIHQGNMGLLKARGTGVRASKGQYLIFVDSDDYLEDNLLVTVDRYIDEYDPDYINYSYIKDVGDKRIVHSITDSEYEILNKRQLLELFVASDKFNSIWSKVVRADIFRNNIDSIYDMSTNIGEDKIQTAFLISKADKAVFVGRCLYHYVIRQDSIVHNKSANDIYNIIAVDRKVENIVRDTLSDLPMRTVSKDNILGRYNATAIDGVLEHIYKYNKYNDIDYKERLNVLNKFLEYDQNFWEADRETIKRLKIYNRIRYKLFVNRRFNKLISLDRLLHVAQKLIASK